VHKNGITELHKQSCKVTLVRLQVRAPLQLMQTEEMTENCGQRMCGIVTAITVCTFRHSAKVWLQRWRTMTTMLLPSEVQCVFHLQCAYHKIDVVLALLKFAAKFIHVHMTRKG